jgi:C1A family cysteine protease
LKKKNENIRVNWNNTEYLSPVKDQGQCGSCYAFSTTNVLETFMRINNYTVDRLSEQQIVDCSPNDYGCEGGFMHTSFDYIIDNKGLLTNDNYKYMGITQNCTTSKTDQNVVGSNITEYQFVIPSSVQDLKDCVMKTPIAIAVDANNVYFRFYKKGVIDVPLQQNNVLNHAVVLVGFDYDEDGMYWIIQNSWGKDWGDNGFCKIRAQEGNGVLLCQKYGIYPVK